MRLDPYRRVLALPGVRSLVLVALLARVPVIAAGFALTMHVLLDLGRGYAAAGLVGAASTIGSALGAPVLGRFVDRRGLRPMLVITAVSLVFFSLIALYLIFKQRGKLAAIALAASMIPAGLSMVVGVAKTAPYFSLADVARYLNPRLERGGHAMFEGPLDDSSSLIFYLNQKFFFVNQNPRKEAPMGAPATDIFLNEQAVLDKWGQPDAVYLIVEQSRADYWKQRVISRFHVYHQVTTSGTYLVLSNQL